jgi:hypothetical protein
MTTTAPVVHALRFEKETRPLQPTPDGYARYERTGRARATCTCGLDTGWIATAEAVRAGKEHHTATVTGEYGCPALTDGKERS